MKAAVAATGVLLLYGLVFAVLWLFMAGLKLVFGDIALWVVIGLCVLHMWWQAFRAARE